MHLVSSSSWLIIFASLGRWLAYGVPLGAQSSIWPESLWPCLFYSIVYTGHAQEPLSAMFSIAS